MAKRRYTIAIQARSGATRLPNKMSRPFYHDDTILDVILARLVEGFDKRSIVVATSTSPSDQAIVEMAQRHGVRSARGSENDVLGRVLAAVGQEPVDSVVRVCADNPFLRPEYIHDLLDLSDRTGCDYASYVMSDGRPSILSHLGLFAEVISYQTLKRIGARASSQRHREHMTSHILDHLDEYHCEFIPVPDSLAAIRSLRLTVDTSADFATCQRLYMELVEEHGTAFSVEQLVAKVRESPDVTAEMAREIATNEKS